MHYAVVTFAEIDAPSPDAARATATRVAQALRHAGGGHDVRVGAVHASVVEGELVEIVAGLRALTEAVPGG